MLAWAGELSCRGRRGGERAEGRLNALQGFQ